MIDAQGKLLIAPPGMPDARFRKTVVFIWRHDVSGGWCCNQQAMPTTHIQTRLPRGRNQEKTQRATSCVLRRPHAQQCCRCASQHRIQIGQHQHHRKWPDRIHTG